MSAGEANFGLEISRGVLAKFAMAAIGFAGSVVFARVLGPSDYGAFYVVVTLVNVLNNPVTGWGNACKKRITETAFPTEEGLGSGLLGAIALPLIMLPAVYTFHRLTSFYDLTGLFVPFSVLFITICFFAVTNRILSARSNFSAAEWSDTLRSFLTTPLQLAFVILGYGTAGMIFGLTAATALTVPYVLYRVRVKPVLPTRETLSNISSYAKYSITNGFIGTAQSRFDILLLGALLTSSAVGDYQVSMQLTLVGTFIGAVTSKGLMARVSEYSSENNESAVITDVTNSLAYASVLAIPIFFGAAAMPNDLLITVFGSQYSDIGPVLVGLAFFQALKLQSSQLTSTIAGLNHPEVNTRISFVVLVLNVGLGYILLLKYGILGVVTATIVSEIVRYTALAHTIKQHLPDVPLFSRPLRCQLIAGGVMFAIVNSLHAITEVSWWGELLFLVGFGGIVYSVTLTVISESFRVTVHGVVSDTLSD